MQNVSACLEILNNFSGQKKIHILNNLEQNKQTIFNGGG